MTTQDRHDSRIDQAREKLAEVRDKAGDAYATARERAIDAYDQTRDRARSAKADAGRQLTDNPIAALGAGLAVGALIGALLPRSQAEKKALGAIGSKLNDTARSATDAAKEAGRQTLADLNLTREAGQGVVQSIAKGLGDAAKNASQAAIGSARKGS